MGKLASLEFLELSCNCISELPDSLGRLPRLRELYLQENMIAKLPPDIGKIICLQTLNIRDDQKTFVWKVTFGNIFYTKQRDNKNEHIKRTLFDNTFVFFLNVVDLKLF